jgi:hypothetical protein
MNAHTSYLRYPRPFAHGQAATTYSSVRSGAVLS